MTLASSARRSLVGARAGAARRRRSIAAARDRVRLGAALAAGDDWARVALVAVEAVHRVRCLAWLTVARRARRRRHRRSRRRSPRRRSSREFDVASAVIAASVTLPLAAVAPCSSINAALILCARLAAPVAIGWRLAAVLPAWLAAVVLARSVIVSQAEWTRRDAAGGVAVRGVRRVSVRPRQRARATRAIRT